MDRSHLSHLMIGALGTPAHFPMPPSIRASLESVGAAIDELPLPDHMKGSLFAGVLTCAEYIGQATRQYQPPEPPKAVLPMTPPEPVPAVEPPAPAAPVVPEPAAPAAAEPVVTPETPAPVTPPAEPVAPESPAAPVVTPSEVGAEG